MTNEEVKKELGNIPASDERSPDFVHSDGLTNRDIWGLADEQRPVNMFRRCVSCGEELGRDWERATVHLDRENGITCGGKIID